MRLRRHGRTSGYALIPVLAAVAVLGLLWWQRAFFLAPVGTFLDPSDPPQRTEAIVVLAGGRMGERVLKAGELVRAGYAPFALLSGPKFNYDQPECQYAIPFAVQKGFPESYFQCSPNDSNSTEEEAAAILADLQRRGVKTFLVVSSDTHIRRARAIYLRQLAPGMQVRFVSTSDPRFRLNRWWEYREGRKAVLLEWVKLATSLFGL